MKVEPSANIFQESARLCESFDSLQIASSSNVFLLPQLPLTLSTQVEGGA